MSPEIRNALRRNNVTPSEIETVELALSGLSNQEIAAARNVKLQTVKHQLTSVNNKVGTRSRHKLIVWCAHQENLEIRLKENATDMLHMLEKIALTWTPIQKYFPDPVIWMGEIDSVKYLIKKVRGL